jgi:hypothetical protein
VPLRPALMQREGLGDCRRHAWLAAAQVSGGDAMREMKAHLERLRDQAVECAILSAEAQTREKRELFAKLCADLLMPRIT